MVDFEVLQSRYPEVQHPPLATCKMCEGTGEMRSHNKEQFVACYCTYIKHADFDGHLGFHKRHISLNDWYMYPIHWISKLLYESVVKAEVYKVLYLPKQRGIRRFFGEIMMKLPKYLSDFIVWGKFGQSSGIAWRMSIRYQRILWKYHRMRGETPIIEYSNIYQYSPSSFTMLFSAEGLLYAYSTINYPPQQSLEGKQS